MLVKILFLFFQEISKSAFCRNIEKQPKMFYKKMFLKISQNLQENNCARVSFLIKLQTPKYCKFIKRETLAQRFSSKFCEIFKNTYFEEHLWAAASENIREGALVFRSDQRWISRTSLS